MKAQLKSFLIKACKRLGETSPLLINWRGLEDLGAASDLLNTMRVSRYLEPKETKVPSGERVLVFAPHPDDEIIGPGGTLVKMLEQGCTAKIVVFSNDRTEEVSKEIKEIGEEAGYETEELNFAIRGFPKDAQALHRVPEIIEEFKPDHLFLTFMLDDHPDHREVSEILFKTCDEKRFEKITIWAYQVYTTIPLNAVVNIGDTIERKMELLRMYKSRFKGRDWCHWSRGLNAFNIRFLTNTTDQDYAEVFFKTSMKNYLKLCKQYFQAS